MTVRLNTLQGTFVLLSLMLCLVMFVGLTSSYAYVLVWLSPYYCAVPIVLGLLVMAPIIPTTRKLLPRIVLACWLCIFMRAAFDPLFMQNPPWNVQPWTDYFVPSLILGVSLLPVVSKTIAALGPIRLTVSAGFAVVLAYAVRNLAYPYDWFGMYDYLDKGMRAMQGDAVSIWLQNASWIGYRLILYVGLGYLMAKRRGLLAGLGLSVLVALVDCVLGWLVFLAQGAEVEVAPFSLVLKYEPVEWLKVVLAQVTDLSIFALLGALVALIRWPKAIRRPVRFITMPPTRHRPSQRVVRIEV